MNVKIDTGMISPKKRLLNKILLNKWLKKIISTLAMFAPLSNVWGIMPNWIAITNPNGVIGAQIEDYLIYFLERKQ